MGRTVTHFFPILLVATLAVATFPLFGSGHDSKNEEGSFSGSLQGSLSGQHSFQSNSSGSHSHSGSLSGSGSGSFTASGSHKGSGSGKASGSGSGSVSGSGQASGSGSGSGQASGSGSGSVSGSGQASGSASGSISGSGQASGSQSGTTKGSGSASTSGSSSGKDSSTSTKGSGSTNSSSTNSGSGSSTSSSSNKGSGSHSTSGSGSVSVNGSSSGAGSTKGSTSKSGSTDSSSTQSGSGSGSGSGSSSSSSKGSGSGSIAVDGSGSQSSSGSKKGSTSGSGSTDSSSTNSGSSSGGGSSKSKSSKKDSGSDSTSGSGSVSVNGSASGSGSTKSSGQNTGSSSKSGSGSTKSSGEVSGSGSGSSSQSGSGSTKSSGQVSGSGSGSGSSSSSQSGSGSTKSSGQVTGSGSSTSSSSNNGSGSSTSSGSISGSSKKKGTGFITDYHPSTPEGSASSIDKRTGFVTDYHPSTPKGSGSSTVKGTGFVTDYHPSTPKGSGSSTNKETGFIRDSTPKGSSTNKETGFVTGNRPSGTKGTTQGSVSSTNQGSFNKNSTRSSRSSSSHQHSYSAQGSFSSKSSFQFENKICQLADDKSICQKSLSNIPANNNNTEPKAMFDSIFQTAQFQIDAALNFSIKIQESYNQPQVKEALENCHQFLVYSVSDFQRSIERLNQCRIIRTFQYLHDLKTWISAALTFHESCLDALDVFDLDVGKKMREAMEMYEDFTNNGLAILSQMSKILSIFNLPLSGQLQSDGGGMDDLLSWLNIGRKGVMRNTPVGVRPNVKVAQDGSGKYKTITEALKEVPKDSDDIFVIYIKAGVYNENVLITKEMDNLFLIGDGPTKTRIIGKRCVATGHNTYNTATVGVDGDHFMAKDIGFENHAGPQSKQAVALRVSSDRAVLYNCHIHGDHNTLFAHAYRQFYRECIISGSVDFIFGDAAAVFQNSRILLKKPQDNSPCIVTAQRRANGRAVGGIVFHNCSVQGAVPNAEKEKMKAFLGRPAKNYSRAIVLETRFDFKIQFSAWAQVKGAAKTENCWLAEFGAQVIGAAAKAALDGVQAITQQAASAFTVKNFIDGDRWIPATGCPYTSGMIGGA